MDRSLYVCAFRGRRDGYQVPLALAEAGRLDRLITDSWAGPALRGRWLRGSWREKLSARRERGIPDERVRCLWATTAYEHLRHRLGGSRASTYAALDGRYGRTAAARARQMRADLLLYTPYAWEAFTARYPHQPRRVLFQYHPHAPYEERLLRQDLARFPEMAHSFRQETGEGLPEPARRRIDECWRHADHILCASSFTRRTLLEAGADPARCVVAPYGGEAGPAAAEHQRDEENATEGFQALFVGSGVQRKGLHHLLHAWERARLPAGSRLTLVCRTLDPGLREALARARGVDLRLGVGREELGVLYRRSTLFVMPSLVEGFGQVYLEALAAGCPALGTAHTCLPDLGGEQDGVFLVEPSDLDHLAAQLERLADLLPRQPGLRDRARACSERFTWPAFRDLVRASL